MVYVTIDFFFNQATPQAYRFSLHELQTNTPVMLKQGALLVVVAHYDPPTLQKLNPSQGRLAGISQSFRQESRRVDRNGYFVALGYGTKSHCPLQFAGDHFSESCSDARYDLLGRSMQQGDYADLKIPQYTFNHDYSSLTIE